MASLETASKYYILVFSNRNRRPQRKKLYFSKRKYTKAQVKELQRTLEIKYKTGEYDPWSQQIDVEAAPEGVRLSQVIDEYIAIKGARDWRASTATVNKHRLHHFLQYYEGLYAEEVTAQHLNDYINAPGMRYHTRINKMRTLKALSRWANKKAYTDIALEQVRVYAVKSQKKGIKYLALQDQRTMERYIIDTIRGRTDYTSRYRYKIEPWQGIWLVRFLRWQRMSGMRISETMSLRVSSIDIHSWDVTIGHEGFQTKSGHQQRLSIAHVPALQRIAQRWVRDAGGAPDNPLHSIKQQRVRKLFNHFRHILGYDHITIHTLRHSCAIDLCRAGVDIYRVKRWLRHADIATTMIYADLTAEDVSSEIGRVFG